MDNLPLVAFLGLMTVPLFRITQISFRMWCVWSFKKSNGKILRCSYLPETRLFMIAMESGQIFSCRGEPGFKPYGFLVLGQLRRLSIVEKTTLNYLVMFEGERFKVVKPEPYKFPENVVDIKKRKTPNG